MAITSYDVTCEKKKLKKPDSKSPYLTGDRVQLLSRVTEKRFVHKKILDYVSSFPLAVNIYKTNSDDLKSMKRGKKKIKKSVLTLPNNPAPVPQICTVSDMNDSEYTSQSNDRQPRLKKRTSVKNVRKPRIINKEFEFYDRDARYCSQFNIDLDSSSSEFTKHKGDGKSKNKYDDDKDELQPHGVWAVLRNMNRFQFNPSPPLSEESIITPKKKKKKFPKKRMNCKDTRVIETCRTEEIAYISSYSVDDNSAQSVSQSSSFDRITVINKQDEFSKICKEFEETFKTHVLKDSNNNKNRIEGKNKNQKKKNKKGNTKALCYPEYAAKENSSPSQSRPRSNLGPKPQNCQESGNHISIGTIDSSKKRNDSSRNIEHTEITSASHKNKGIINIMENNLNTAKGSSIYSDHTGSSKALITDETFKLKGKKTLDNTQNGHISQLKGISRVIFTKPCDPPVSPVVLRRPDVQRRKPRLVTTMPSACMMPKLTQTEIKRRLANMRFPIVILGKDQVSSTIEVQTYNPTQFQGLDKQIWPFMLEWEEHKKLKNELMAESKCLEAKGNNQLNGKWDYFSPDVNSNKMRKKNIDMSSNRQLYKPKKYVGNDTVNKNKTEIKRPAVYQEINGKIQQSKKQSIAQLKDKMLNLLYRKISNRNISNNNNKSPNEYSKQPRTPKIDACTDTQIKCVDTRLKSADPQVRNADTQIKYADTFIKAKPKLNVSPVRSPNKSPQHNEITHRWAKAKWASDFIENVIKKIKNGVYYSQDHKYGNSGIIETSVQTEPGSSDQDDFSEYDFAPKVEIMRKQDTPTTIPGFDNSLPELEIKIINMNEVAIKHSVTNVTMQFDVTVLTETNQIVMSPKTSSCLIPVEVTETPTKIFKYQNTLLNAMLPAELCSILPKMMSLFEPKMKSSLRPALCSGLVDKTESYLSTISELSRSEFTSSTAQSINIGPTLPLRFLSPTLKKVLGGVFSSDHKMSKNPCIPKIASISCDSFLLNKLLPDLSFKHTDIFTYRIRSFVPEFTEIKENGLISNQSRTMLIPDELEKKPAMCTALEIYTGKNKRLVPGFKPYNFETTVNNILQNQTIFFDHNLISSINLTKIQYDGKTLNLNLHMDIPDSRGLKQNMSVTIKNFKIDSLFPKGNKCEDVVVQNRCTTKCIEYIKQSYNSGNKDRNSIDVRLNNKYKRKGFYRLYRKCKSATNIPIPEKCSNTPLNKILSLEDFFQILGSKRTLATVFDGYASRKILSSIVEMKNWITDINPRQALLVLLLTNKKDTPNLVRFRPVILQGIAVNRITQATELDMEIEVIERENFNKISQYEGISYLPESVENQNQLMDELYWIAKTTASDYQRPFDESSERLLKSLLEKRKKLNPSYLRVMARYVGLGLLKSPAKK